MAGVKRLSKVAKELNVGISTIVDHLNSIGEDIGSNPNTKIGEDLYLILLYSNASFGFFKIIFSYVNKNSTTFILFDWIHIIIKD